MAARPDRRSELAEAAYQVVAEGGIDGLSLRTVARRVGATTGLLSHHFADRRDLIGAALEHAAATMLDRVAAVPDDAHPLDLLAAVLPTDEQTVEVWRFSLSVRTASLFDDELGQFDRRIRDHWDANLPARLTGLVPGDRGEAARHLVALVDGISFHAVLDPTAWPPERQIEHLRAGFVAVEQTSFAPKTATTTVRRQRRRGA
jgi:TetR/AcrR family transcriptional repressor of bet genes